MIGLDNAPNDCDADRAYLYWVKASSNEVLRRAVETWDDSQNPGWKFEALMREVERRGIVL